jgi:DNA gyrase subunit A
MIEMEKEEKISAVIPIKSLNDDFLLFSTREGTVKKTATKYYSNPRKKGIIAIKLDEQDELISVKRCKQDSDIMIFTEKGMAVHFISKDVRAVGRNSSGVRGIRLEEGDKVISLAVCSEEEQIATITSKGYGKRTEVPRYRLTRRGGKGVRNILLTEKNGKAVDCLNVIGDEEILVITAKGIIIRTNASDIPTYGRNSQGVRVIRLDENDEVVSFSKIID